MPSSKSYLDFVLDQLSGLKGVAWRAMMGEYVLYYHGKIIGGIYDDRFLVKPTQTALSLMPLAAREKPYEGANDMLLVDRLEDKAFLETLLEALYDELPAPKKRKNRHTPSSSPPPNRDKVSSRPRRRQPAGQRPG